MNYARKSVSIIIPTFNGNGTFEESIEMIRKQEFDGDIQIVIVDSESNDSTIDIAKKNGCLIKIINRNEFSHSKTRNYALEYAIHDNVLFMVQDAIPCTRHWLKEMVSALVESDNNVCAVYCKQVPHNIADPYARAEVEQHSDYLGNMPMLQKFINCNDIDKLSYCKALRLIRLDNVCAIYKKEVLKKIRFPDVRFAEDMAWALKALEKGYAILYQPNIKIMHSHNREPAYRFKRSMIDTIVSSIIINKVSNDLSSLSLADCFEIEKSVYDYFNKYKTRLHKNDCNKYSTKQIHDKMIFLAKRIILKVKKYSNISRETNNNRQKFVDIVKDSYQDHIIGSYIKIKNRYNLTEIEDLRCIIDQLQACTMGHMYGLVYSSYLVKKQSCEEFKRFVEENTVGV